MKKHTDAAFPTIMNKTISSDSSVYSSASLSNTYMNSIYSLKVDQSISTDRSVHSRLYDHSQSYQLEGKERRREIEAKLDKAMPKGPTGKISLKRACRLYYVKTKALELRYQKMDTSS